jgi:phosphoribosylanthranilate isomerase
MLIEKLYEDYERNQPPFSFGIQLNINWPDPNDVKRIKDTYPKLSIILQVSGFSSLEKVKSYYGFCDYILIDSSKGRGIEFNLNEVVKAYRTIQEYIPTTIGIAGGFSPENVRGRVLDLRKSLRTDNFCIDAQNRLRTNGHLDMHKVDKYLKEAIEAFQTKI